MKEWQSSAHVKWECKYHLVIVPKYRKKVMYGRTRTNIGRIIRQLCRQKEVGLVEGHAMLDHLHLVLSIPPKVQCSDGCRVSEGKISDPYPQKDAGNKERIGCNSHTDWISNGQYIGFTGVSAHF